MRACTGRFDVVVVGVSAGGVELLSQLLPALPARFPAPLVVCIHAAPGTTGELAQQLRERAALAVREARDKEALMPGTAYLAPGGYHLFLERDGTCGLSLDPPVRYARPSVDVLFDSAAHAYGPRALAVVLSGANDDGAEGARRIKAAGGTLVVQDPATARAAPMPRAALAAAAADHVVTPDGLAQLLVRLLMEPEA
jgi:two-component system, chemotaxis family, protein-glutamate methylesterase/glutaminase